jgi:hypothetical protein
VIGRAGVRHRRLPTPAAASLRRLVIATVVLSAAVSGTASVVAQPFVIGGGATNDAAEPWLGILEGVNGGYPDGSQTPCLVVLVAPNVAATSSMCAPTTPAAVRVRIGSTSLISGAGVIRTVTEVRGALQGPEVTADPVVYLQLAAAPTPQTAVPLDTTSAPGEAATFIGFGQQSITGLALTDTTAAAIPVVLSAPGSCTTYFGGVFGSRSGEIGCASPQDANQYPCKESSGVVLTAAGLAGVWTFPGQASPCSPGAPAPYAPAVMISSDLANPLATITNAVLAATKQVVYLDPVASPDPTLVGQQGPTPLALVVGYGSAGDHYRCAARQLGPRATTEWYATATPTAGSLVYQSTAGATISDFLRLADAAAITTAPILTPPGSLVGRYVGCVMRNGPDVAVSDSLVLVQRPDRTAPVITPRSRAVRAAHGAINLTIAVRDAAGSGGLSGLQTLHFAATLERCRTTCRTLQTQYVSYPPGLFLATVDNGPTGSQPANPIVTPYGVLAQTLLDLDRRGMPRTEHITITFAPRFTIAFPRRRGDHYRMIVSVIAADSAGNTSTRVIRQEVR